MSPYSKVTARSGPEKPPLRSERGRSEIIDAWLSEACSPSLQDQPAIVQQLLSRAVRELSRSLAMDRRPA